MKNFFHTIALLSFILWTVGFFSWGLSGNFHFVLLLGFAASIALFMFKKQPTREHKNRI
jgi:hypothetical protein